MQVNVSKSVVYKLFPLNKLTRKGYHEVKTAQMAPKRQAM